MYIYSQGGVFICLERVGVVSSRHGDSRLGIVFGLDILAGLVTWNRPGDLLAHSDLVLEWKHPRHLQGIF